jgi:hypothetical protein
MVNRYNALKILIKLKQKVTTGQGAYQNPIFQDRENGHFHVRKEAQDFLHPLFRVKHRDIPAHKGGYRRIQLGFIPSLQQFRLAYKAEAFSVLNDQSRPSPSAL